MNRRQRPPGAAHKEFCKWHVLPSKIASITSITYLKWCWSLQSAPGVLRTAVPGWLNAPPLRGIVLSFAYAQPQHGGSGALYVLLKRNR